MRRSILFLTIYLAILYNIERVDLGQVNLIDMSSMLYVVVMLVVAMIVFIRPIGRLKLPFLVVGAGVLYLLARAFLPFLHHRPLFGGVYTYLTVTELSFLIIGVILAHDVAANLNDFEEAVRNITLSDIQHKVQHLSDATEEIQREIMRSRRHNYPISMLVMEPDPESIEIMLNRSVLEVQKRMMARYAVNNLMRIVSNMTRRTDLVIDQAIEKEGFVVMMPDTDTEHAELLAERLRQAIHKQMGVRVSFGLATFPNEALTFEELVQRANAKLQCEKDLARLEQREPVIGK